jgi:hypothetical protein
MPGHTRRPNPKGIVKSLSTLPFHFPTGLCGVRNRDGLNVSGSSNRFGSLTSTLRSWRQMAWSVVQKEVKRTRCYRTRLHLWGCRIHYTHRLWSSHVVLAEPLGAILWQSSKRKRAQVKQEDAPSHFFDECAQEGQRTLVIKGRHTISSDDTVELCLNLLENLGEANRSNCRDIRW